MSVTIKQIPQLHHPEVEVIVHSTFRTSVDELKAIFELPRNTLIEDLETLIRAELESIDVNSIEPFNYVVLICLQLLAHLRAEESLPFIMDVFRRPEEEMDILFGDLIYDGVYDILVHCGQNQLDTLVTFIKDKSVWEYSRAVFVDALAETGLHFPEKKAAVVECMSDLLHHFNDLGENEDDADMIIVTSLTTAANELDAKDLLPVIEALFQKEQVEAFFMGTWEEYQADWEKSISKKRVLSPDFWHWYTFIGTQMYKSILDDKLKALKEENRRLKKEAGKPYKMVSVTEGPKIGRNDPCHCGSGKKYKKCHGA